MEIINTILLILENELWNSLLFVITFTDLQHFEKFFLFFRFVFSLISNCCFNPVILTNFQKNLMMTSSWFLAATFCWRLVAPLAVVFGNWDDDESLSSTSHKTELIHLHKLRAESLRQRALWFDLFTLSQYWTGNFRFGSFWQLCFHEFSEMIRKKELLELRKDT